MPKRDILDFLRRKDKWYLGGGNRLLWSPEFPLFLDRPGFWDHASYYNVQLKRMFTWTILDSAGKEVPLESEGREWNPAYVEQRFRGGNIEIVERKSVLPNDVAVSSLQLKNKSRKTMQVHVLAWSVHESGPETKIGTVTVKENGLSFERGVKNHEQHELRFACAFGTSGKLQSYCVNLSEGPAVLPEWRLTPFSEKFSNGRLPNEIGQSGVTNDGLVFAATHTQVNLLPSKDQTVSLGLAVAPTEGDANQNLRLALKQKDPVNLSVMSWQDHFSGVPFFECSDVFLKKCYWYRWYGLRLNTMYGNEGNYSFPVVCEGIGTFRAPISYSAQCHMLENRWMHEPELARGSLLTFIENQRDDGGFRGYIDVNYYRQEMFYHANWGNAVRAVDSIHPSSDFLETAYQGLRKYGEYFVRERDKESSGLYDIDNHYETGQEYMHRYTAVNPKADEEHWGEVFRLKGVDVTVYLYELARTLAAFAEKLGKNKEAEQWTARADKTKKAILESMWDPEEEMFFDIDPATSRRTKVKAAICFYPYFTDVVDASHLAGLKRHLLNPKEFWTPFPVPSSSADDELFSSEPEWKGKRMNCPWNGRVWPMTNSHIAEALATCAVRFNDQTLKEKAVEFMTRFIRMMFFDGDPSRPNCFEHYNPLTGTPSVYRGIDDYQHSWVDDLIIKYVCGIRPDELSVTIDPFPFGIEKVLIDEVMVRGRRLKVEIQKQKFTVWVDGKQKVESRVGKAVSIQI